MANEAGAFPSSAISASGVRPRIPELDGLRGIAVGMVLIWHFVGSILDPSLGTWTKIAYNTLILGRTGVDLFFVLSGFLITGIILDKTQSAPRFLEIFYIRRVLRIVPSYILLVIVFWIIVIWGVENTDFNTTTPLWRHLTFTQNLWMADHNLWGPGAISVTWSVAIEEQYYLIFPFVSILLPRRILPIFLILAALFSCFFRVLALFEFKSVFMMYVHTLSRLDGLAIGGVIAYFWRLPLFDDWLATHSRFCKRWVLIMIFGIPILAFGISVNLPMNMAIWGHTYLALFYGTILVIILKTLGSQRVAFLRIAVLRYLGSISYTVYLFHPLFLSIAFLLVHRPQRLSGVLDVLVALIALMLTLGWSSVSQRWLENPLIAFGRRWRY